MHAQGKSRLLPLYATSSTVRSAAKRARYCSRLSLGRTTSRVPCGAASSDAYRRGPCRSGLPRGAQPLPGGRVVQASDGTRFRLPLVTRDMRPSHARHGTRAPSECRMFRSPCRAFGVLPDTKDAQGIETKSTTIGTAVLATAWRWRGPPRRGCTIAQCRRCRVADGRADADCCGGWSLPRQSVSHVSNSQAECGAPPSRHPATAGLASEVLDPPGTTGRPSSPPPYTSITGDGYPTNGFSTTVDSPFRRIRPGLMREWGRPGRAPPRGRGPGRARAGVRRSGGCPPGGGG